MAGLPTYRYQYAGNFSNISPVSWFGAYHSSELPLLFGTHDQVFDGPSTAFEYNVSHAMQGMFPTSLCCLDIPISFATRIDMIE